MKKREDIRKGDRVVCRGIRDHQVPGGARADMEHRGRFVRYAAVIELDGGMRLVVDETSLKKVVS